jgi:glycosyltransferase involved in cell wall biosynthesis
MDELASAYAAARIHVLPSWYELPGLVSLEAAAAGTRVATTDWGTAPDYFGDKAWYLPPDDPVRMREVLLAAMDSAPKPGLREHVLENFSWDRTARAAMDAYRRALAGRRAETA